MLKGKKVKSRGWTSLENCLSTNLITWFQNNTSRKKSVNFVLNLFYYFNMRPSFNCYALIWYPNRWYVCACVKPKQIGPYFSRLSYPLAENENLHSNTWAISKPLPGPRRMLSLGTRTSLNSNSACPPLIISNRYVNINGCMSNSRMSPVTKIWYPAKIPFLYFTMWRCDHGCHDYYSLTKNFVVVVLVFQLIFDLS